MSNYNIKSSGFQGTSSVTSSGSQYRQTSSVVTKEYTRESNIR